MIHFFFISLILANFNIIFNYHNPPFCIIQPKWMCERNITCTNNASSSSSALSQIIVTIFPTFSYPPLCSLIPLYSLYTLTGSWALGVKGTVLYNCGVELGVCD